MTYSPVLCWTYESAVAWLEEHRIPYNREVHEGWPHRVPGVERTGTFAIRFMQEELGKLYEVGIYLPDFRQFCPVQPRALFAEEYCTALGLTPMFTKCAVDGCEEEGTLRQHSGKYICDKHETALLWQNHCAGCGHTWVVDSAPASGVIVRCPKCPHEWEVMS